MSRNDFTAVHDLIAQQAALDPAALAVSDENQQLTFAELNARSNRLARHIQKLGVSADTPVGLYFERSVHFVVAALAVLKAGGAYVPLDAAYPPARIDEILKDASVPVLLSHKWMAAGLAGGPWKTVDLDVDAGRIAEQSEELPSANVSGENLAYIIYTSGSTGKPKGVEITHANLLHLVRWHVGAFEVTAKDRASQVAGLAFDAAVWEVWCHLAAGASLHMIDEVSRLAPETLREWLMNKGITISFVPTVIAEHLITCNWPKDAALRIMLTGADTLHRYPGTGLPFRLVNNYGPTECTVLVTSGSVSTAAASGRPNIGRPIDDTEILIMDSSMTELPIGEEGEICVAGPQIGRGYRNLPALTAEKFVHEPGSKRRIYRTGDLGRFLPTGEVDFLGRMDDQIKMRGFRVEPGEIVAQLMSHPQIRNGAVIVQGDAAEDKSLIAYLVLADGSTLTGPEIRTYLQARLPEYMIPACFVKLPVLPLTTAGKCDKQALPAPMAANRLPEPKETQPAKSSDHDETESLIAQLVSGLMGGKPIGRDDNFFLIGGHSMLAAQLIARVRETMAVSLNLRQLFEAPTISALAAIVAQKLATK